MPFPLIPALILAASALAGGKGVYDIADAGGRIKEAVVLSYKGTAERFVSETARLSPETQVRILAPGQRLRIRSAEAR